MDKTDKILNSIRKVANPDLSGKDLSEWAFKVYQRDRETFEKAEKAVEALANLINVMGSEAIVRAGLINGFLRTHRYLECKLIETLLLVLGDLGTMYSEHPERFADARNEFALKLCEKLREDFNDKLYWQD